MTEILREFVGLPSPVVGRAGAGGHPCQGLYHRPAGGRPRTAFIATHYNVDFSEHYLATLMAERGFGFLGWNTRFRGNEAHFLLDHALAEIGVGMRWLREQAGVETDRAARQLRRRLADGGLPVPGGRAQRRPVAGMRPLPAIEELPPGDLFVALAAHSGRPEVFTALARPLGHRRDRPAVGRSGARPVQPGERPALQRRVPAPVPGRPARPQRAHHRLGARPAGGAGRDRARDRLFTVPRSWADLRMIDPSIEPSDRRPNWCYLGEPLRANYGVFGVGTVSTLRSWLSMWSLRTSQCTAAPHLARITLPSLVVHATADACVYESDARALYDALAAPDKQLEFIKADHYLTEPGGARQEAADLLAAWVNAR